jgi:hypothetical protein
LAKAGTYWVQALRKFLPTLAANIGSTELVFKNQGTNKFQYYLYREEIPDF